MRRTGSCCLLVSLACVACDRSPARQPAGVDAGGASPTEASPASCATPSDCAADQVCTLAHACVAGPRVFLSTMPDLPDGTWHHAHAVPVAVAMVQSFAGLTITTSADPNALVTLLDPSRFDVLVFPTIGPWRFNDAMMASLAAFLAAGKGFAGIHAAADTASFALGGGIDPVYYRTNVFGGLTWSGWPWLTATVHRADVQHPSTTTPSMSWADSDPIEDELYAFVPLPAGRIHLLLTINTPIAVLPHGDAYAADTYVVPHPTSLCRQHVGGGTGGGRAWVTALGHMSGGPGEPANTYALPWFQEHVYAGILWAAGIVPGECPDDNPAIVPPTG